MAEYICREAILDDLEKEIEAGNVALDEDVWVNKGLRIAIRDIKDIKTADVQPVKHGRWESSQRTIETGTVYCSNCAMEYYISDLQTVGDCNGIVHYCPNCGARMDLKDGEE